MSEQIACGHCNRGAPYDGPYDVERQCRLCYNYANHDGFRRLWGGLPLPDDKKVQCRHKGKELRREVCGPCGGRVQIKVFECAVHGECTLAKKLPGKACCSGCLQGPVVVRANANGIGDALMGLCAVAGFAASDPRREVIYKVVNPWQEDWVKLFHGYDRLTVADVATITDVMLDINNTPEEGADPQFKTPRWEHYANAIRSTCAVVPALRPLPHDVLKWAERFKGKIALCPFSVWMDRAWDADYWHRLEDMLYEAGYETVILDGLASGPGRAAEYNYRGELVYGEPAARVAALLKAVRLVVANESGCAHMAGMVKAPCLALSWFHPAQRIHGIYGTVRAIHADHVRRGGWKRDITPEMVYAKAMKMLGVDILSTPRSLLTQDRLDTLARCVRETTHVRGDLAELGVYEGGSALHMLRNDTAGRTMHLFDTFAGLPAGGCGCAHGAGEFAADRDKVARALGGYPIVFHQGVFPATAPALASYSVVHVDADLYESTRDAIAYFWPRLLPEGYIVFDDWKWDKCPGVERAVLESPLAPLVRESTAMQCWVRKPRAQQ